MKEIAQTFRWWLSDRLFPVAQPLSPKERQDMAEKSVAQQKEWEDRTAALDAKEESLGQYLAACKAALEDERQRQQSVDTRLATIIGLSSIAGTIAFGTMLANIPRTPGVLFWLIFVLLGYLILQLISAMHAAVCGLERRSYDTLPLTDILPNGNEVQNHHVRRQIQQYFSILVQHQDQNNAKVTQMAVAHRAIKNFVGGLLIFAILASTYRLVTPSSDELVNRLKTDHVLRELLRGPQGQTGLAGPMGPPGVSAAPAPNTTTPSSRSKSKAP